MTRDQEEESIMLAMARSVAHWLGAATFFAVPPFVSRLVRRWNSRHASETERACRWASR